MSEGRIKMGNYINYQTINHSGIPPNITAFNTCRKNNWVLLGNNEGIILINKSGKSSVYRTSNRVEIVYLAAVDTDRFVAVDKRNTVYVFNSGSIHPLYYSKLSLVKWKPPFMHDLPNEFRFNTVLFSPLLYGVLLFGTEKGITSFDLETFSETKVNWMTEGSVKKIASSYDGQLIAASNHEELVISDGNRRLLDVKSSGIKNICFGADNTLYYISKGVISTKKISKHGASYVFEDNNFFHNIDQKLDQKHNYVFALFDGEKEVVLSWKPSQEAAESSLLAQSANKYKLFEINDKVVDVKSLDNSDGIPALCFIATRNEVILLDFASPNWLQARPTGCPAFLFARITSSFTCEMSNDILKRINKASTEWLRQSGMSESSWVKKTERLDNIILIIGYETGQIALYGFYDTVCELLLIIKTCKFVNVETQSLEETLPSEIGEEKKTEEYNVITQLGTVDTFTAVDGLEITALDFDPCDGNIVAATSGGLVMKFVLREISAKKPLMVVERDPLPDFDFRGDELSFEAGYQLFSDDEYFIILRMNTQKIDYIQGFSEFVCLSNRNGSYLLKYETAQCLFSKMLKHPGDKTGTLSVDKMPFFARKVKKISIKPMLENVSLKSKKKLTLDDSDSDTSVENSVTMNKVFEVDSAEKNIKSYLLVIGTSQEELTIVRFEPKNDAITESYDFDLEDIPVSVVLSETTEKGVKKSKLLVFTKKMTYKYKFDGKVRKLDEESKKTAPLTVAELTSAKMFAMPSIEEKFLVLVRTDGTATAITPKFDAKQHFEIRNEAYRVEIDSIQVTEHGYVAFFAEKNIFVVDTINCKV